MATTSPAADGGGGAFERLGAGLFRVDFDQVGCHVYSYDQFTRGPIASATSMAIW